MSETTVEAVDSPFNVPPPETLIWRYLSFPRYVAMLERGGLFFPRGHLLGDPFEGSLPVASAQKRDERMEGLFEKVRKTGLDPADLMSDGEFYEEHRKWMLVSCWHMNAQESAAMWRLYDGGEGTVAIRSTVARLRAAMPDDVKLSAVKYLDYQTDPLPRDRNVYSRFLGKRRSFSHEAELRAIWWDTSPTLPDNLLWLGSDAPDSGRWFSCDLKALIEMVFVSPLTQAWVRSLIEDLHARFGLSLGVAQSALDDGPLF